VAVSKLAPRAAYYLFEGGTALLHALALTLMLVFQVQVVGLTPFQLVIMGTAMEVALLLFEIPTGAVADLYSRRRSVLIGTTIIAVSLLLQGGWPYFWPTLAGQMIWGLGYTFISGAAQAWITDEIGEDHVQPVFTRATQVVLACSVAGTVVAGLIGQIDLRLPMLVAGAGFVLLALALVAVMPEHGFRPVPKAERETWAHLGTTVRAGLNLARRRGVVRSMLWVSLLVGLSSEAVDRLWTAHVLEQFTLPSLFGLTGAAAWFSVFALVGTLVSLLASLVANRLAGRRLNAQRPAVLLAGLVVLQVAGILGFAVLGSLWPALVATWVRDAARVVSEPVQAAWLNREVESGVRATTLSIVSQANALGEAAGGPPMGAVAGRFGIAAGLLGCGVILAPAAGLFLGLRSHTRAEGKAVS
jgi:DHA3 family tetracycline resistance protein-like MFS transporter